MKVMMMTGDAPRHRHLVAQVAKSGLLGGHVIETREPFVPAPPSGLDPHLRHLFELHFAGRASSEQKFFGAVESDFDVPTLQVSRSELNSAGTGRFISDCNCDAVVSYGVHKLEPGLLDEMPPIRWNTHGGLSPWYRGVITLFWPSYMLEPQKTGITLHELTGKLDAGPIIHQTVPELMRGDGVHDLANRAVSSFADELPRVLGLIANNGLLRKPQQQSTSGKLWVSSDWRPEHLRLVYDVFANRIVDRYLDGAFKQSEPKIVRQF